MLVLLALLVGLAVGHARGGNLRTILLHRPRRLRLLVTAIGLYTIGVLGGWIWTPLLPTFSALCGFALAYFAWVNQDLRGTRLVAAGFAANSLVLLVNGAVPFSTSAAMRAGIPDVAAATDELNTPTAGAIFPWLGEVIPVAFPLLPQVASPGDIAIAAGIALVVASAMLPAAAPARQQLPQAAS